MYVVIKVIFVICALLGERVSGDERKLFRNTKSPACPNGVVYREACNLCFCIRLFDGSEVEKCKTKFSPQACRNTVKNAHCETENLLYDYSKECEGECVCNKARNRTICENLPCDDTLLWFHGYYNESDKGHPVRKGSDENDVEPALKVKSLYLSVDEEKVQKSKGPNKSARRLVSHIGNGGSNSHDAESESEDSSNKKKHLKRRLKRAISENVTGDADDNDIILLD